MHFHKVRKYVNLELRSNDTSLTISNIYIEIANDCSGHDYYTAWIENGLPKSHSKTHKSDSTTYYVYLETDADGKQYSDVSRSRR